MLFKIIVIVVAAYLASWLLEAMWLMLAIGDIHRNWWPSIPLMGYSAALPIAFCLTAFLSIGVAGSTVTSRRNKNLLPTGQNNDHRSQTTITNGAIHDHARPGVQRGRVPRGAR